MAGIRFGRTVMGSRPRGESWIQPPRLRTVEEEHERHASWLELFFDLVFVVAIAQLSHELVGDHSPRGFALFGGLFVPVFVAWQGFSFYADRFDTDDLIFRGAMLVAMLAIAALAILIPDVWHGEQTAAVALAYVALRVIMLGLYARAHRAVPEARPLTRRYGLGYSLAVGIWLLSLALPEPVRYILWGIGLAVDLSLPPISIPLHRVIPTSASHVPERWGLFTIIALGESVVAVALGARETEFDLDSSIVAALGFFVVACLWWLYFDGHEGVTLKATPAPLIYSYAHLPLLIGLAAVSAGISLLIEEATHDHLTSGAAAALGAGTACYLLALLICRTVTRRDAWHAGARAKLGGMAASLGLVILAPFLPPVVTVAILLLLLVVLVAMQGTYLRAAAS
ncbi:MAG: low temperature requirement protein A [Thermomicrobiales bacterium]